MFSEEDRFIEEYEKYGETVAFNRAVKRICKD